MACRVCVPELNPSGPRRGPGHFGTRFGGDWRMHVFKRHALIQDCYEVDIDAGRAWRIAQPPRLCACGQHAEAYIDTGEFSVAAEVPA